MELSEAIEILRNNQNPMLVERCKKCEHAVACLDEYMYFLALDTVLQGLEKLQKENEGIKARVDKYLQGGNETLRLEHEETLKYYHENYISKDKIKEKIVNLKVSQENTENDNLNREYQYQIDVLEELVKGE